MGKPLSIRFKILAIAFLLNVVCVSTFTVIHYFSQKRLFLEGVDKKLLSAAYAIPLLLPEAYHDGIIGPDSVTQEQYSRITQLLSDYADKIHMDYLYSYMQFQGDFYEVCSSISAEERKKNLPSQFFLKYRLPPRSLFSAWGTQTIRYDEYTDEWGHYRSIFIPLQTAKGTRYVLGADISVSYLDKVLKKIIHLALAVGLIIFLLVWYIGQKILNHLMTPIVTLTAFTRDIYKTDFTFSPEQCTYLQGMIDRKSSVEIQQLANAYLDMERELLDYIARLKVTTAIKERLESELQIAREIQMSFLKTTFPPFPLHREFDLYARIVPAKEVGGDLYDYWFIDKENLFFYVGDVADKGVPAALLMGITMSMLKITTTQWGSDPAVILSQVNQYLAQDNENMQFVTLCCGILNIYTGALLYSNAGHTIPLILRTDGSAEWLKLPNGIVLGIMPQAEYLVLSARLEPNDSIILYSDGVTEAMNNEKKFYSSKRLFQLAQTLGGKTPEEQTEAILASIKDHVAGAPPSDDIAILVLKRNPMATSQ